MTKNIKIKYRKYSVIALIALGSCSVLQNPESKDVQVEDSYIVADSIAAVIDTSFSEEKELEGLSYEDNSIPDSIWERDQELLLKELNNDEFISAVDSTWMNQLYSAGVFKDNNNLEGHKTKVLHVDDSIIKNRLAELNSITPLDLDYNPYVKRYINTYLYKRSAQMERMMGLAEYYYPMFEEVLDKYNVPLELKHLAIVESALNPRAKSRVGASGLWQFMYGTGKQYGLKVSSYVDERFDPIKATEASARYMSNLYRMFGDWNLVLAAYNSGPGNVKKAIRRSGGHRNYWYLRPYLPRETRGYVPAFIAVNYTMHYAKEHNLKPISPKISYYKTDTVLVRSQISFKQISEKINISKTELEFLNPSYKFGIIPDVPSRKYKLVLPISVIDDFVSNEDSIYAYATTQNKANKQTMPKYQEANDRIRYKVRSGDNLGYIANKYGVRVSDIKRWNGLKSNNLRIGQRLTIYPKNFKYSSSKKSSSKSRSKSKTVAQKDIKGGYTLYTVKSGDNLWTIAKRYPGISADNIQSWNGIKNTKDLKPGMKLKIATKS